MSVDQLAVLDGSKCIVQVRGVRPFLSDKYDLTKHPNYRLTADYDKKYWFDVEKYLNHRMTLRAEERYEVIMQTPAETGTDHILKVWTPVRNGRCFLL